MDHVDGSSDPNGTANNAKLEHADGTVVADLLSCRQDCEELDRTQILNNEGRYRLAQRIAGNASRLADKSEWEAFRSAAKWGARKPPKSRDHRKALRHAIRFVLPPETSRQVLNYWSRSLELLIAKGVEMSGIADALRENGGFEAICRDHRKARSNILDNGQSEDVRLVKNPSPSLPKVLRDAIISHQDGGRSWIEDGADHTLLFLRVPSNYRERIQPGEVAIRAVIGHDDFSILDVTRLELISPASLLNVRHQSIKADPQTSEAEASG